MAATSQAGRPAVLSISWNQDQGCFALGTESGYAIWNSEPVQELCRRDIGGVKHVAMYLRSSILAFVGGGRNPFESPNKVIIWNDAEEKALCHIEFRLPVLGVQRQKYHMVVVTLTKIFVYNFPDKGDDIVQTPRILANFDTIDNPNALFSMSYNPLSVKCMLVFPANTIGHACITEAVDGSPDGSQSKSKPPITIKAHKSRLAYLGLSPTGRYLASSSENSTLVRVFNVETCEMSYNFRRGLTSALVYSMSFNRAETMLCGVFDDMLYLWKFSDAKKESSGLINLAEKYLPNFESNTTPAFTYVHTRAQRALCAFETDRTTILTVCWNGTARKFKYHSNGMQTTEFHKLLKENDDELVRLLDIGKKREAEKDIGKS